jgi:hypothetical protein
MKAGATDLLNTLKVSTTANQDILHAAHAFLESPKTALGFAGCYRLPLPVARKKVVKETQDP